MDAPEHLEAKGLAFWVGISGSYDLRIDELRMLEDICHEIDLVDRMQKEMRGAPLTVTGSMGQIVAHPIAQELRQHRAALKSLMAGLKLPDDGEAAEDRSSAARAAANARWGRRGA